LLEIAERHDCAYVYERSAVRAAAGALRGLKSVDRLLYAMKANPHAEILRLLAAEGLGFECVSRGEIEHLLASVPDLARSRILFTPNFAPLDEYLWALEQDVQLTLDNVELLSDWGKRFRNRSVFVRVDTGTGRGHHHHVRTAGAHAKFGVPLERVGEMARLAEQHEVHVVGLHAHSGSGIFHVDNWTEVATALLALSARFPQLQAINVGGGLGVPDSSQQAELDLRQLDTALLAAKQSCPGVALWIEPGRYLVAAAGVLLARVTQIKSKDDIHYIGVATGMNSLIRPALYGAWHEIVNLSRLEEPPSMSASVVGPICESADFLGHDRLLPVTHPGDVLLIATAGAYGHTMSSRYNLREPAPELLLP
jgi:diaminopimelate decarboxylase/aspartate kinase